MRLALGVLTARAPGVLTRVGPRPGKGGGSPGLGAQTAVRLGVPTQIEQTAASHPTWGGDLTSGTKHRALDVLTRMARTSNYGARGTDTLCGVLTSLDCTSSPDVAGGEFPRSLGGRSESRSGEVAILKRSMAASDEPSQTATMNREAEVAGLADVRTTWLPALGLTRNENPPAGAGSAGP